jgi:hypothetical protein
MFVQLSVAGELETTKGQPTTGPEREHTQKKREDKVSTTPYSRRRRLKPAGLIEAPVCSLFLTESLLLANLSIADQPPGRGSEMGTGMFCILSFLLGCLLCTRRQVATQALLVRSALLTS